MAFGVLASSDHDFFLAGSAIYLLGEEAADLGNANCLSGGGSELGEGDHLIDGPTVQHLGGPDANAVFQGGGFPIEEDPAEITGILIECFALFGNRASGQEADFEGALDVAGIVAINPICFDGIEFCEAPVEFVEGERFQLGAKLGTGRREVGRIVGEELEVKAGTTHHDGQVAAGDDLFDDRLGQLSVGGGIEGVGGIADPEEVVGQDGLFFSAGGGGDCFQAPIELEGVAIDDFSLAGLCDGEGCRRFTGGGGTAEEESVQYSVFRVQTAGI